MERDLVCGMDVDPKTAQHTGRIYYFCAAGCKRQFEADPGKYLAKA